ncbi:FtsW/RodA/SpoVE family cell cycle protein [Actinomyces vulturis]|uniref:FtsW/RodA/SpoVE family cell cycle protein n=1 Tax=Actinomyces vulturis TaxID=1857645 RepID=UPI00083411DE|nr:FtsW/RodA/SpoVE family cell cycle protein [Actinomyces vulturis]
MSNATIHALSPQGSPRGVIGVSAGQDRAKTSRRAEFLLLIPALLVGLGGYLLTSLNRSGHIPPYFYEITAISVVIALVLHLWIRHWAPYADPVFLPIAVALNGLGLAMIQRLDLAYIKLDQLDNVIGIKQLLWSCIGVLLCGAIVVMIRDHRQLRRWDRWAMWLGLVALVLPFVPGLGITVNGSRIWILIPGLGMSFQPAELTKVLLAIFFASYLVANRDNLALASRRILGMSFPRARHLLPLLVVWGLSILVLVAQRDLGTSLMLFGLFVVSMYVATDRPSWLFLGGALFIPAAWFAATHLGHVSRRITAWLHAMDNDVYSVIGGSGQIVSGLFGLASGGIFGTGWGQGYPNLVPFANSDFIVASLGEELGLTGSLAIMLMYIILIERGMRTAMALRDGFGKLLAVSLSFTMALQVFVVVGGITRLIPLTGLTMPFLAYGGSSLVANWIILALLLRLSDSARRPVTHVPAIIDTADLPKNVRKRIIRSEHTPPAGMRLAPLRAFSTITPEKDSSARFRDIDSSSSFNAASEESLPSNRTTSSPESETAFTPPVDTPEGGQA